MMSKLVLSLSAIFLIAGGAVGNFMPDELARWIGMGDTAVGPVVLQVSAALLLGLGVTNWLSRNNPVESCFRRPLILGNLLFFGAGAFAVVRALSRGALPSQALPLVAAFVLFAICFLWLEIVGDRLGVARQTPAA